MSVSPLIEFAYYITKFYWSKFGTDTLSQKIIE